MITDVETLVGELIDEVTWLRKENRHLELRAEEADAAVARLKRHRDAYSARLRALRAQIKRDKLTPSSTDEDAGPGTCPSTLTTE